MIKQLLKIILNQIVCINIVVIYFIDIKKNLLIIYCISVISVRNVYNVLFCVDNL